MRKTIEPNSVVTIHWPRDRSGLPLATSPDLFVVDCDPIALTVRSIDEDATLMVVPWTSFAYVTVQKAAARR